MLKKVGRSTFKEILRSKYVYNSTVMFLDILIFYFIFFWGD